MLASFEASIAHAETVAAEPLRVIDAEAPWPVDVSTLNLPPLPIELRPRAEAIHRRQEELSEQLRVGLRQVRQQHALTETRAEPRRALYLDHRV